MFQKPPQNHILTVGGNAKKDREMNETTAKY